MNFMRRAMTSIKRRPGKTLILLLLVFILGSVISGAISVTGAITNTEANLRRGMRPIVSFDMDEEALMREMEMGGEGQIELMTPEMVRQIGALSYVSAYDYSIFYEFWIDELVEYRGNIGGENVVADHEGQEILGGWFTLRGTSMAEPLDMREGVIELNSGNLFSDAQIAQVTNVFPVLISTDVAEINNLMIGSTFTIERTFYRPIMDDDWDRERTEEDIFAQMTHEFEVVGLFDPVPRSDINMSDPDQEWQERDRMHQLANRIYVPNVSAEIIQRFEINTELAIATEYWDEPEPSFGENPQLIQTIVILNDVGDIEAFREVAEAMLPDMWFVTDLSNSFAEISSSMEILQDIADWILTVSIGATLLILSLLITLFLKDRRYEMGVYLALGEKKSKIISQILIEIVTTALIGITLAVFTGHFVSSTMSQNMLRNELIGENQNWNMDNSFTGLNALEGMGFDENLTVEEMMDAFDVSLDIRTIGIFYAVGLGAVMLSTVMPVIYIVALKPKKVLM